MINFKNILTEALEENSLVFRHQFKGTPKKMTQKQLKKLKKLKKIKKKLNIQPKGKFKLGHDAAGKYIKIKKTPEEVKRKIKTVTWS